MKYRPFSEEGRYPSTNCWRGYQAVWKIIDNKLFLEKIIHCNNKPGEENIIELFKKNEIQYQKKNGMILANWCTMNFYKMTFSVARLHKDKIFLYDGWNDRKSKKKMILQIENGIITINKL